MLLAENAHPVRVPERQTRLLTVTVGAPYDGFAKVMSALLEPDWRHRDVPTPTRCRDSTMTTKHAFTTELWIWDRASRFPARRSDVDADHLPAVASRFFAAGLTQRRFLLHSIFVRAVRDQL